ncbi:proprotein convertase P-domain-containing protein, partial [Geitlerinema sp. P-1104]|uniref:proprotein convertase P-domain-containing protein n=1 Tax=Geitlerinema sp. P-1104 TaxID=2546230 RepID=UPI002570E65B
ILEETADKIVDEGTDPQLGTQFGQYDGDGHSKWFGYGKVNAYKAVLAAQQKAQSPPPVKRRIRGSNDRQMSIPDNQESGVSSPIRVRDSLAILELDIKLELDHPDWGDLEILLLAPQQSPVMLQGRGTRGQGLFSRSYDFTTTPQLKRLFKASAEGTWQLQVRDRAVGDTGVLTFWQLTLGVG